MSPGATDETVTIELARSHAAAERSYEYGIPALAVGLVVASIVVCAFLWALTLAVRELAAASRVMGAAIGVVGESRAAEDGRAEERHREAMAALADVKATVIARL